jgi:PleD family two-component response regulator
MCQFGNPVARLRQKRGEEFWRRKRRSGVGESPTLRAKRRVMARLASFGEAPAMIRVGVLAEPAEAEAISERIRNSILGLSIPHELGIGGIVRVSCDVVSTTQMQRPLGERFQRDLLRAADIAMYQAKSQDRNAVRVFDN